MRKLILILLPVVVLTGAGVAMFYWQQDSPSGPSQSVAKTTAPAVQTLLASGNCTSVRIVHPPGSDNPAGAASYPIFRNFSIAWEPSDQLYMLEWWQGSNRMGGTETAVGSGTEMDIEKFSRNQAAELRLLRDGEAACRFWVWIE